MTATAASGVCRICGDVGALTFEHVPPRKAFNSNVVFDADSDLVLHAVTFEEFSNPRTKRNQKGAGGYTLCRTCNNLTGSLYVNAYVELATQAKSAVERGGRAQFCIEPLAVSKQIMAMFASANGPGLFGYNPGLRRFVINKDQTGIPDAFRIFAHFVSDRSLATRQAGVTVAFDTEQGSDSVFSELSFLPIGFILSHDGSAPPDKRLVEVTSRTRFAWKERATFTLDLPILEVSSPFPGDFRTALEIQAAFEQNPRPSPAGGSATQT